jgi:exosortase A-associated hydrolase 1
MDRHMRSALSFALDGQELVATLDSAPLETGLLIVTGGTQVRIGPHRSFALLAARVAAAGFPVFRFDRRGIGDSEGDDPGFADSGPDIAAATAAFRHHCPQLRQIAGFGLCDGASALAFHHQAARIDALLLANPWAVEPSAGLPPPAAIRRHYLNRLTSLRGWSHLLRGAIDLRKAARGLRAAASLSESSLAANIGDALASTSVPITVLLAEKDATALAFDSAYRGPAFKPLRSSGRATVRSLPSGSHSFAAPAEADWLARSVIEALEKLDSA